MGRGSSPPELPRRSGAAAPTVTGRAVESLRSAVLEGRFAPGERLVEADLCARLGVSRASLREALRMLAAERLITLVPHRGPAVAEIDWAQAEEIYEVRALLEGEAAARAALMTRPGALLRLRRALLAFERAVERGDARGRLEATGRFYDALLEGSGGSVVAELLSGLVARITFLRARSMSSAGRSRHSAAELRRLLVAVEARDPVAARAAAVDHVRAACEAARAAYARAAPVRSAHAQAAGTARACALREPSRPLSADRRQERMR